jgi:hypothetical protein
MFLIATTSSGQVPVPPATDPPVSGGKVESAVLQPVEKGAIGAFVSEDAFAYDLVCRRPGSFRLVVGGEAAQKNAMVEADGHRKLASKEYPSSFVVKDHEYAFLDVSIMKDDVGRPLRLVIDPRPLDGDDVLEDVTLAFGHAAASAAQSAAPYGSRGVLRYFIALDGEVKGSATKGFWTVVPPSYLRETLTIAGPLKLGDGQVCTLGWRLYMPGDRTWTWGEAEPDGTRRVLVEGQPVDWKSVKGTQILLKVQFVADP